MTLLKTINFKDQYLLMGADGTSIAVILKNLDDSMDELEFEYFNTSVGRYNLLFIRFRIASQILSRKNLPCFLFCLSQINSITDLFSSNRTNGTLGIWLKNYKVFDEEITKIGKEYEVNLTDPNYNAWVSRHYSKCKNAKHFLF